MKSFYKACVRCFFWEFALAMFIPSAASYADDAATSPFTFAVSDIQKICEKSSSVCEIWIDGVIEGIEFLKIASAPDNKEVSQSLAIFCFGDFSADMKQIRTDFLESLSREKGQSLETRPALPSLIDVLEKYRCAKK